MQVAAKVSEASNLEPEQWYVCNAPSGCADSVAVIHHGVNLALATQECPTLGNVMPIPPLVRLETRCAVVVPLQTA